MREVLYSVRHGNTESDILDLEIDYERKNWVLNHQAEKQWESTQLPGTGYENRILPSIPANWMLSRMPNAWSECCVEAWSGAWLNACWMPCWRLVLLLILLLISLLILLYSYCFYSLFSFLFCSFFLLNAVLAELCSSCQGTATLYAGWDVVSDSAHY